MLHIRSRSIALSRSLLGDSLGRRHKGRMLLDYFHGLHKCRLQLAVHDLHRRGRSGSNFQRHRNVLRTAHFSRCIQQDDGIVSPTEQQGTTIRTRACRAGDLEITAATCLRIP